MITQHPLAGTLPEPGYVAGKLAHSEKWKRDWEKKKSELLAMGEQHQSLTQISAYMVEKHIVGTRYFGPVTTMKGLPGKSYTLRREYSLIVKKV